MDDRERARREAKQALIKLIESWVARTGLRRESLSARAGFPEYNLFYKAYLDTSRAIGANPERALGVVRAVTVDLPRDRRATPEEVLSFLKATGFPLNRFDEVWPLFAPAQWHEARLAFPALMERLPPPPAPDGLATALARVAAMPDLPPAPAPLPLPHRMPLIRGRLFTGRDAELRTLVGLLRHQGPDQVVAITGLGGVGKTSLASELAHRCGQFFAGGVFWVSCAQPATVAWEVAACGESGLVERDDWPELPIEERARLVTLAWQEPVPRLLIFDGCEDDATLRRWRPTTGGSRLVLTSRRAAWSRALGVTTLPLRELTPAASVALLHAYRPDRDPADPALVAIAGELGGLPLALHLAGSYLETYQNDAQYGDPALMLRALREGGPLAHDALRGEEVSATPTDHDLSLERTFGLSLARIREDGEPDRLARALLARAARLAPGEPFAPQLLAAAASAPADAPRALRLLVNLGLLGESNGALYIHRLVADFADAAIGDQTAAVDVRRALVAQTEAFYQARDAMAGRQLLPHLARHAEGAALLDGEAAAALLNALPFLLELGGDLAGGLAALQGAHGALLRAEQIETPLGAEVLNNLAEWHRALGDAAAARPLHEEALAIRRALFPPLSPPIAESLLNLGETLREGGELARAQEAYEGALAIGLKSGGEGHELTLAARNQLALLLFTSERYPEARTQFEALLAPTVARFGADDPRAAIVRNNLATTLARLGDHEGASVQFELVVANLKGRLGDTHPETLRARLNAARALVLRGDLARGIAELRPLVEDLAVTFGAEHQLARHARETLAEATVALQAQGGEHS